MNTFFILVCPGTVYLPPYHVTTTMEIAYQVVNSNQEDLLKRQESAQHLEQLPKAVQNNPSSVFEPFEVLQDSFDNLSLDGGRKNSSQRATLKRKQKKNISRIDNTYSLKDERNTIANIGNRVLTYACSRIRSQKMLAQLLPGLTYCEIRGYYVFARRLRAEIHGYLNLGKLKKVWFETLPGDEVHHTVLRELSKYYLKNLSTGSILQSRKMPKANKPLYVKISRMLLKFLTVLNC